MDPRLEKYFRRYKCSSGNHQWGTQEQADKCCHGWVRVGRLSTDEREQGGYAAYIIELWPVNDLDNLPSNYKIQPDYEHALD